MPKHTEEVLEPQTAKKIEKEKPGQKKSSKMENFNGKQVEMCEQSSKKNAVNTVLERSLQKSKQKVVDEGSSSNPDISSVGVVPAVGGGSNRNSNLKLFSVRDSKKNAIRKDTTSFLSCQGAGMKKEEQKCVREDVLMVDSVPTLSSDVVVLQKRKHEEKLEKSALKKQKISHTIAADVSQSSSNGQHASKNHQEKSFSDLVQKLIPQTAKLVAKNGASFEKNIHKEHSGDPSYNFLNNDSNLHQYYSNCVRHFKNVEVLTQFQHNSLDGKVSDKSLQQFSLEPLSAKIPVVVCEQKCDTHKASEGKTDMKNNTQKQKNENRLNSDGSKSFEHKEISADAWKIGMYAAAKDMYENWIYGEVKEVFSKNLCLQVKEPTKIGACTVRYVSKDATFLAFPKQEKSPQNTTKLASSTNVEKCVKQEERWREHLRIGSRITVFWGEKWYSGRVRAKLGKRILLKYDKFAESWDEWLPLYSDRIAKHAPEYEDTSPPALPFSDVSPFHAGQELDAKDINNNWFRGEVVEVYQNCVKVHFDGWDEKYDQTIKAPSEYIAPPGQHADPLFQVKETEEGVTYDFEAFEKCPELTRLNCSLCGSFSASFIKRLPEDILYVQHHCKQSDRKTYELGVDYTVKISGVRVLQNITFEISELPFEPPTPPLPEDSDLNAVDLTATSSTKTSPSHIHQHNHRRRNHRPDHQRWQMPRKRPKQNSHSRGGHFLDGSRRKNAQKSLDAYEQAFPSDRYSENGNSIGGSLRKKNIEGFLPMDLGDARTFTPEVSSENQRKSDYPPHISQKPPLSTPTTTSSSSTASMRVLKGVVDHVKSLPTTPTTTTPPTTSSYSPPLSPRNSERSDETDGGKYQVKAQKKPRKKKQLLETIPPPDIPLSTHTSPSTSDIELKPKPVVKHIVDKPNPTPIVNPKPTSMVELNPTTPPPPPTYHYNGNASSVKPVGPPEHLINSISVSPNFVSVQPPPRSSSPPPPPPHHLTQPSFSDDVYPPAAPSVDEKDIPSITDSPTHTCISPPNSNEIHPPNSIHNIHNILHTHEIPAGLKALSSTAPKNGTPENSSLNLNSPRKSHLSLENVGVRDAKSLKDFPSEDFSPMKLFPSKRKIG